MKEIREHGSEVRYYHTRLGVNGRLDTIQCAILLAKLERYEWEIAQRQKVADKYNLAFKDIKAEGFSTPYVAEGNQSVWAQYTLTVPNRDSFQKKMQEIGVPTSIHYPRIMPDQPWYQKHTADPNVELPIARWAAQNVVSIPMYPDMTDDIQDQVIVAVKKSI